MNIEKGELAQPQKILGFDFSQSGGQIKWLDRIVNKIRTKSRQRKLKKLRKQHQALVQMEVESDNDMSDRTISTSGTESTSCTDDGSYNDGVDLNEDSNSSQELPVQGKYYDDDRHNVLLEDDSAESI